MKHGKGGYFLHCNVKGCLKKEPFLVGSSATGTNKAAWNHVKTMHPERLEENKAKPQSQHTTTDPATGVTVNQLAPDDPTNFAVCSSIIKYLLVKGLPLSHVECPELRDAITTANPAVRLCCYETAQEMQTARRAALKATERAHFAQMREKGHLRGPAVRHVEESKIDYMLTTPRKYLSMTPVGSLEHRRAPDYPPPWRLGGCTRGAVRCAFLLAFICKCHSYAA